jgi:hypothetical protein
MRKIPTLFNRDPEDMRRVVPTVHPDCQWVLDGEGVATRKIDGTCVMLDDEGRWWGRREVKPGKTPPPNYRPVETDPATGKTVGWEPIDQSGFRKAFQDALNHTPPLNGAPGPAYRPGTYELIGPKVNGNPERVPHHMLVNHDDTQRIMPFSLTYEGIRDTCLQVLAPEGWEGLVWHHPDGRMAKVKVRDFR